MFLLTCKSYINKKKSNLTLFLFVNVNQMSSLRIYTEDDKNVHQAEPRAMRTIKDKSHRSHPYQNNF